VSREDEFARILLSDERKKWQDPLKISKAAGVMRGMTIADLACGPGFFTLPLASLVGEGGIVYAVDASKTMLDHLRKMIATSGADRKVIKVIQSDVADTGIPSCSVDVALFANVLHDIEDKGAFLNEVRRICKPAAVIVDVDWKRVRMKVGPPYGIRLTEATAQRILAANGFRTVKSLDIGPYHYGLTCRR
jgi:ubiquinone/menaquinone biosynthesis C-methylase UbiE